MNGRSRFARWVPVGLVGLLSCVGAATSSNEVTTGETSYHEWNWATASIPAFSWPGQADITGGGDGWTTSVEYGDLEQIGVSSLHLREPGSRSIRFFIDSQAPLPEGVIDQGGTGSDFRSEINLSPWHDPVPLKTEYWLGWSYCTPPGVQVDATSEMTIFQGHVGRNGPPVEIYVAAPSGHIFLLAHHGVYGDGNNQQYKRRVDTGVQLVPGRWYDLVLHIIWDVESGGSGLTELWIDGVESSIVGGNVFDSDPGDPAVPYAGTPKFGMYKSPWRDAANVAASKAAGVTQLEMYLGPVRFLKNSGSYVGTGGYSRVAPVGTRPTP